MKIGDKVQIWPRLQELGGYYCPENLIWTITRIDNHRVSPVEIYTHEVIDPWESGNLYDGFTAYMPEAGLRLVQLPRLSRLARIAMSFVEKI